MLLALGMAFCRRSADLAPQRASESNVGKREAVGSPPAAARAAPAEPDAGATQARTEVQPEAGAVDRDEAGLLRMYDEMAEAIEMSTDDCDAIEYAFATAVEGGRPHLQILVARARASQRNGRPAEDPLLVLAKARMQRLFSLLRKLPPECGRQLSTELRKLSESTRTP